MAHRGAPAAREGLRTQALVALYMGLLDRDWVKVALDRIDTDDPDGKADLLWDRSDGRTRLDQVKMRSVAVSAGELKGWADQLGTVPADEKRLVVVGPLGTKAHADYDRVIEVVQLALDYASLRDRVVPMLMPAAAVNGLAGIDVMVALVEQIVTALEERAGGELTRPDLLNLVDVAVHELDSRRPSSLRVRSHRTIVVRRSGVVFELYEFRIENLGPQQVTFEPLPIFWTEAEQTLLRFLTANTERNRLSDWPKQGTGPYFVVQVYPEPIPGNGSAWWGFLVERHGVVKCTDDRKCLLQDVIYGVDCPAVHRIDVVLEDATAISAAQGQVQGQMVRIEASGVSRNIDFAVRWTPRSSRAGMLEDAEAVRVIEEACDRIEMRPIPGFLFD